MLASPHCLHLGFLLHLVHGCPVAMFCSLQEMAQGYAPLYVMHCELPALTSQLPEMHATSTQLLASFDGREVVEGRRKGRRKRPLLQTEGAASHCCAIGCNPHFVQKG